MSVFGEMIIDSEWGNYYVLKPAGYAAIIIAMIAIFLLGNLVSSSGRSASRNAGNQGGNQEKEPGKGLGKGAEKDRKVTGRFSTRQLVFSAMAMALAYVTSFIKIIDMPMGGSVTLLSMMFICMIGCWYGLRTGLSAAVAYGCLQFVTDPYIISIPQMLIDYFFAFGALGLSGLFFNRKNGLIFGYLTGVAGRFVFVFLSGMIFFGTYASAYNMTAPLYSFLYNGAYLGLEALITIIIMALPPVSKAFARVKEIII